jgi:hypothetical protein
MRTVLIFVIMLLSAACTEPDLSTPDGRAEHDRRRAVAADINKHKWDSWPTYAPEPAPRTTTCWPVGRVLMCD